MLGQLADDVQLTIKELRELAHGIYPPLLADNGLGDALRAAASRSPLKVLVAAADDIGRYPAEVEAAIYFSCLEALQNAAKHAPDATVQLRLWTESGGLLFSVTDDGPGFDPAAARAAATASSTWRTGSAPSAEPCAGTPGRDTAPRSAARSRWSPRRAAGRLSRAKAPESRSCHSCRSASAPKRSLLTYPLAPLSVALRGRSARS